MTPDKAAHHAKIIEMSLLANDKPRAEAALQRAFEESHDSGIRYDDLIDKILPPRLSTILNNGGIETIEQLCQESPETLMEIKWIGRCEVKKIKHKLGDAGFYLS